MKKRFAPFSIFLLIVFLLASCGTEKDQLEEETNGPDLTIYTTVYPLQYFAEAIGGNAVHVETIYPPGSDEHTFEPTQKDMMMLADADLFFYIGFGLEGFVEKAKKSLANENVIMVATGENIHFEDDATTHEEEEASADGHAHGDVDPHVWLDPIYAKELAETIKDTLVEHTPENEEMYEKNYQAVVNKLDELNNKFIEIADNAKNKKMIVSHGAYGYWEERYGMEQISISGLSSSSEPSQKQLEKIIKTAKEDNMHYIFFEQNISSSLTDIVQNELNADPLVLHNLSVRTDEDIKENRDYFSIMNDNLEALKKGLE
jgi:zinc transport system substrate-binding protein